MAESLKEVIAKLKANSQQSKPSPTPIENLIKKETSLEEEEEAEEQPQEKQKPVAAPKEIPDAEISRIVQEIELLQNNGRFRAELLNQLNGMRESLAGIAELLVMLAKNGKA